VKPAEIDAAIRVATMTRDHAIAIKSALLRAQAVASYGANASDWSDVDKATAAADLVKYQAALAAFDAL